MTQPPPTSAPDDPDDPVEHNRSQNPRRTPGRAPVGAPTTRRLFFFTLAAIAVATAVLIVVLAGR